MSNQVPHPASAGREVYVRDQLVLQPANGWVRFIRQAQVLLDRATAASRLHRLQRGKKTLALAGHAMSYGLARDSVSLSVADGQLEAELAGGPR